MNAVAPWLLAAGLAFAAGSALAQAKPHQHGVVKLDIAVEGGALTISLVSPLDNLVGFERAPRTDVEKRTAAEALARLRDATSMWKADAAAQCTVAAVEVRAPVLESGSPAGAQSKHSDHAELDAEYRFQCAKPLQLRALEVGLLDAFKRIQRIETQVVTAQGQSKLSLKRPARSVALQR